MPPTETTLFKEPAAAQRLLVVLAHPDDESFGSPPVGTMIHYARQGVEVHLICATRGEAGAVEEKFLEGFDSVAQLRTQELHCAARVLGLTGLHFLNYRDSGMAHTADNHHPASLVQAPLAEVVEKITGLIRQIRPQVVITFDPSGSYFHPDHVRVHEATTRAFYAAGDEQQFLSHFNQGLAPYQPARLYYTVISRTLIKLAVKLLPFFGQNPAALGQNRDINLKRVAEVKQRVTTKIKIAPYFDLARQAARCHASQAAGVPAFVPEVVIRWLSRSEGYTRIAPPVGAGEPVEYELFDL